MFSIEAERRDAGGVMAETTPAWTPKTSGPMSIKADSYHLLRRLTSQGFRQKVKRRVWQLRSRLAPLLETYYGTYNTAELETEIRAHLPSDFEILMVHSSISDMHPMYHGQARELLEHLLRLVGPERTLAMPAFFFGSAKLYNRDYYRKHVRFDQRRTPSQMGLLTELFRRWPGVARSLHPTHSVCSLGPLAEELSATHHLSQWPCGKLSPFGVMGRRRTAILGLGTEHFRSLTQVHAMEEALCDRFPVAREIETPVRVELVNEAGEVIPYEMSCPLSRGFIFKGERLRGFVNSGDIDEWRFKGTVFYVTTAARVDAAVCAAALRGQTLYVPR
jgi:aminoglycoside 3-N-acetyltransferase